MKDKLLAYSFAAVILIGLVNFVANYFYLYWSIWWFDNVAHFLGGFAMAFLCFWIFTRIYIFKGAPRLGNIIFISVSLMLVVGIGWEIFEVINNIALPPGKETYWQDTTYDLIADTWGALAASLIIYKRKLYG